MKEKQQVIDNDVRFRKLIENSFSGITLLDRDLNIIYRSPSAERINGWNMANRLSNTMEELTHPDDLVCVNKVLFEVRHTPGLSKTCTFRIKHFFGHYIWLECNYTNMFNEPEINAIVCNFIDITDRKANEEQLIKSQQLITAITDNVPALIAYWTADLKCVFANKPHLEWFDKKPDEIKGISKKELLGEAEFELHKDHIEKVLQGIPQSFERNFYKSDGTSIYTHTKYIPDMEGNTVKGFYSLISDITDVKLAEQKIHKQSQQIEYLLEAITDGFISLDEHMCYTYVNKAIEEMTRMKADQFIGKNIWELFPDAVGSPTYHAFQKAFTEKTYVSNEDHYEALNLWQENRIYPSEKGLYVFIRNITAQKNEEQQKAQLVSALTESLKEKNTILESIGDVFFALDKNWTITYWNNVAEKILGRPRDEVINKNFKDVYSYAINLYPLKKYQEAMDTNKMVYFEYYSEVLNVWFEVSVFPTGNGLSVYMKDVTDRKNAEALAKTAFDEKVNILESIGDAFFAVDKNWTVTYWNNMAVNVLQIDKADIINHNLWEVFADSVGSTSYKMYHQAVTSNKAVHFEDYHPPLNKWYEISAYPTGNGLSVYFKDITERKTSDTVLKELNTTLQKHAKELAVSNAELEQFAYVASHDLQEPLRMVTGFLTQIERKYSNVLDDKGKQYIDFAVDGAKRMRQIILDLLEFSRIGRTDDNTEAVDMNKIVADILSLYRKQIEEKKAVIRFSNLPIINTYKVPVRQVLQNLISNALKYQKAGNKPVVTINCIETDKHYHFSVSDNGIGIEKEYFDTIFIIFQRLHNKEGYSGTGMGLAVTKKIVDSLGGKIWLESEEGKGSTFYFTIIKK
jgi:PAS domain S-box-containing protein